MKKKFITGFIFCFFVAVLSFNTSAQEYKYDLSKYFTPDIVRNSLFLNFNTSADISNTMSTYNPLTAMPNDSVKSSSLDGQLYSTFTHIKNTRKLISAIQLTGILHYDNSSNNPANDANSERTFNSTNILGFYSSNRFYYSTNHFISYGVNSSLNYNMSKDDTGNKSVFTDIFQNDLTVGLSPSIGIGVGRIESVEDARQAIYILAELSKKGVLTRHLTNDEIFNLSQQISRVKNKRFLDSRIHLMDEIASVDSFFVRNNLLNKSDATYFTNLYDLWLNGANFTRKSGQSFEIDFTPSGSWERNKYENNNSSQTSNYQNTQENWNYGGNLVLSYIYEKPVNLNWQHSFQASLTGSAVTENVKFLQNNGIVKYNLSHIDLSGGYSLGYYPNTRTNLSVGISELLYQSYSKMEDPSISDSNSWYKIFNSTTRLNFSAYYYLSPQLRLSASASIYKFLNNSDNVDNNNFNAGFSAGLSYAFF